MNAQGYTLVFDPTALPNSRVSQLAASVSGGWYAVVQTSSNLARVARFSANGSVLWAKELSGNRNVNNIIETGDGKSVLIFSRLSVTDAPWASSALLLSEDGEIISEQIWNLPEISQGWISSRRFENGEIVAVGSSFEEENFIGQLLLAKFSSTGALLWNRNWDYGGLGNFGSIIEGSGNDFYIVGGELLAPSNLAKFTSDGAPLWGRSYEFATIAASLVKGKRCSDGSLLLVGAGDGPSLGSAPFQVFKTDSVGEPMWSKGIAGAATLNLIEVYDLEEDRLLVTANSNNIFSPIRDNDNTMFTIDADGNLLSDLTFGSSNRDFPGATAKLGNQIVFGGLTNDQGDLAINKSYLSLSNMDSSSCIKEYPYNTFEDAAEVVTQETLFFVELDTFERIDFTTSLEDIELPFEVTCGSITSTQEVGPCPQASGQTLPSVLNQLTADNQFFELLLFDLSGRQVGQYLNAQSIDLNMDKRLPTGLYIYQISADFCGKQQRIAGKYFLMR
ncbi:MAG: hypothetical protein HC821_01370 [Lewinella sp.]|nr:hypothetical protein [Lewinella sp.]